jgi:hypothetical protein
MTQIFSEDERADFYIIPEIRQYPKVVGGPGVKPGFVASDATVLFSYTTHPFWNSRRESNPDLMLG